MMRTAYLVAYDISEPKRWRHVYRLLNGHGDPLQYSVFICWLSVTERKLLEEKLVELLNLKEDNVMFLEIASTMDSVVDHLVVMGKPRRPMDAPPRWYVI
jgi:CRISPR-associated protein Cas2